MRTAVLTLTLAAALHSSSLLAADDKWLEAAQAATQHWRQCISQSYAVQRTETADKNLAVENAFVACKTEEQNVMDIVDSNPWVDPSKFRMIQ